MIIVNSFRIKENAKTKSCQGVPKPASTVCIIHRPCVCFSAWILAGISRLFGVLRGFFLDSSTRPLSFHSNSNPMFNPNCGPIVTQTVAQSGHNHGSIPPKHPTPHPTPPYQPKPTPLCSQPCHLAVTPPHPAVTPPLLPLATLMKSSWRWGWGEVAGSCR